MVTRHGAPTGRALPDPDEIFRDAQIPGYPDLLRPHSQWGLERIAEVIEGAFDDTGPLRLGPRRSLLVLAVDAIGAELAAVLSPSGRSALTSTFPSTSVVAWRTALTGMPALEHLVPGVVYRDPSTDLLYHSFRDQIMFHSTRWEDALPAEFSVPFPSVETLFSRLSRQDVHSVAVPGELLAWPSRWQRELLVGADVVAPRSSLVSSRLNPEALAELAIGQIDDVLRMPRTASQALTWAWINLDDAVHILGPSGRIRRCLELLGRAAADWAAAGHLVLLHSDHGMTPCSVSVPMEDAWARINRELCRLPAGGAGRTRWCYPRPGRRLELRERLKDTFASRALVKTPEELAGLGLLPPADPTIGGRVGEVVVVARTAAFPATMTAIYEHGGAGPDEMLVPVAWWEP